VSQQPLALTSDESLLAAISYFWGWMVVLIVWVTQKEKSRFVRFQAIQAMLFDLIVTVTFFLIIGCMMVFIFGVLAFGIGDLALVGSQANPLTAPFRTIIALMTAVPLIIPCILVPIAGIIFVVRLSATIQTYQGKDFHYPWLGRQIETSLSK
jgi:uncharacterized membrane protein